MEAILSAPVPVQNTAQSSVPQETPSSSDDSGFAPFLANEINRGNNSDQQPQTENADSDTDGSATELFPEENPAEGDNPFILVSNQSEQTNDPFFKAGIAASPVAAENVVPKIISALLQETGNKGQQAGSNGFTKASEQAPASTATIATSTITAATAPTEQPQTDNVSRFSPQGTLISNQIQEILDKAGINDTTISLQGNRQHNPEQLNNLTTPASFTDDSVPASIEISRGLMVEQTQVASQTAAPQGEKPVSQPEFIRQDIHGQYINSKLDNLGKDENQDQQANAEQQNKQEAKQTISNTSSNLHSQDSTSQFTLGSSKTDTSQIASTTSSTTQTMHLPSGASVPEDKVVNQLIERFAVNPRLQTSKVSLKLQPAELGALQIDILVKGDSIKASIMAQSHQVQELLEKNMPRLRGVLEEQGFAIDDIKITLDTGSQGDSNFFNQDSSADQKFSSAKQQQVSKGQPAFTVDLDQEAEDTAETINSTNAVNVTA